MAFDEIFLMDIKSWDEFSGSHVDNLIRKTASVLTACGITKVSMIDVGSNVGKFVERLPYYGVEVNDAILCDIVPELVEYTSNKFPAFKSLHIAISDSDGTDVECYNVIGISDNYGLSRIVSGVYGEERKHVVALKTKSLTTLIREQKLLPDFIKIDAEGYDIPAIYGLLQILRETGLRPVILFECAAGVSAADIVVELNELGYETATSTPESSSRDIFAIPEDFLTSDVAAVLADMPYKT